MSRVVTGMNEQSPSSAGHKLAPLSQIESAIEMLSQIATQLEELCEQIQAAQSSAIIPCIASSDNEDRVRAALLENLTAGSESFSTFELADAVSAALSYDGGNPVSDAEIRKLLPRLLRELFNAKPSCSLRREGKFVRGYRGLTAREIPHC